MQQEIVQFSLLSLRWTGILSRLLIAHLMPQGEQMKHLITTLCTVLLCGYILVASGTSQEVQPTYLVSDVTLYPALIEELTLTTRVLASQCNETVEKSESVSVGTPAW